MDLTTLITGIVCLIAGLVIGMMFANDHWMDRITMCRINKHPLHVDGRLYHLVPDEQYRDYLIADVFHKRAMMRQKPDWAQLEQDLNEAIDGVNA